MGNYSRPLGYAYLGLSAFLLTIDGLRSFPVLAHGGFVAFTLAYPFLAGAALKWLLERRLVDAAPYASQAPRQFAFDFSLYIFAGLLAFVALVFYYHQPELSALRAPLATLVLGYFAASDNALNRERYAFRRIAERKVAGSDSISVTRRFSLFVTVTVMVALLVLSVSAYTHLERLRDTPSMPPALVAQVFLVDAISIFGLIMVLTLRLIHSYSINLQQLFENQLRVLRRIEAGKLDEYVPVCSADEFGTIARATNRMVDELREKDRIRRTLERIVSPNVVDKLLAGDQRRLMLGQEQEVAILFCDLRSFTSYAESTPPEEVIFLLNAYFSKMVEIVSRHNGMVNKFMGDAILAVYPVESGTDAVRDAVNTAWSIVDHARSLRMGEGGWLDVGVGIHAGRAIAGTIGSEERYDYTFIGDAVNTASRLEGLSKRLKYRVIISSEALERLPTETRALFADLGQQRVRGKADSVHVFGAAPVEDAPTEDEGNETQAGRRVDRDADAG